jgi:hypothetical protein
MAYRSSLPFARRQLVLLVLSFVALAFLIWTTPTPAEHCAPSVPDALAASPEMPRRDARNLVTLFVAGALTKFMASFAFSHDIVVVAAA